MLPNRLCFYVVNIGITYAFRLSVHFRAYDLQMDSCPSHLPLLSFSGRCYFITGTFLVPPTMGKFFYKNICFCWFYLLLQLTLNPFQKLLLTMAHVHAFATSPLSPKQAYYLGFHLHNDSDCLSHILLQPQPKLVVAGCTSFLPMIAFLPFSIISKPCFLMFM